MVDLKINTNGDIIVESPPVYPELKLSFITSQYPALKISFEEICPQKESVIPKNGIKLTFDVNRKDVESDISTVYDTDEQLQRIPLLLKTELGDLHNKPDFGTQIYQDKHKNILSQATIDSIESKIQDKVQTILDNPNVIVRRTSPGNKSLKYQTVTAYVLDNNKLAYEMELGV